MKLFSLRGLDSWFEACFFKQGGLEILMVKSKMGKSGTFTVGPRVLQQGFGEKHQNSGVHGKGSTKHSNLNYSASVKD